MTHLKEEKCQMYAELVKTADTLQTPLWWRDEKSGNKIKPNSAEDSWGLQHVSGDLFSCPEDEALAHCISQDCQMGSGIALMFKKFFGGVEELKEQKKTSGQCAVLKRGRRFVYYLITKQRAYHKPTYATLKESLEDMKSHCILNGVTRISMPRIGCGLDRLKWESVSEILEQVFHDTNISVTVYSLSEPDTTVMEQPAQMSG